MQLCLSVVWFKKKKKRNLHDKTCNFKFQFSISLYIVYIYLYIVYIHLYIVLDVFYIVYIHFI